MAAVWPGKAPGKEIKMPIAGIGTWLPTIDEVLAHWASAEAEIGGLIVLIGGYKRGDLVADRALLVTALAAVQSAANAVTTASGDRDNKKLVVKGRLVQFAAAVRGQLPGSGYINSLGLIPQPLQPPGRWNDAMDDASSLWTTINANSPAFPGFAPPLLLNGPFTLANFNTLVTTMKAAFQASSTAEQNFSLALRARDALFAGIYARLKQYRDACVAALSTTSPLLGTIPRLTPLPGSTPPPVVLNASWNAGIAKASLTWTASTAPSLDHYEVRYCTGTRYRAADELVVPGLGSIAPGTLSVNTDFGLLSSGASIIFKVYVVTATGNEKGSNSVKVIRP